jgi:hypothetical protein
MWPRRKAAIVREVLAGLAKIKLPRRRKATVLQCLLQYKIPATIEFGDGRYVRVRINDWDSDWTLDGSRSKAPKKYEPYVVIQIDIDKIRREVLGSAKS